LVYHIYKIGDQKTPLSLAEGMNCPTPTSETETETVLTPSSQDVPFATEFILISRREEVQLKADCNCYKNTH
jgi:hypothetical protein